MMFDLLIFLKEYVRSNTFLLMTMSAVLGLQTFVFHGLLLQRHMLKQNMIGISFLLPPITMIITTTIASNFFLSLGMIGALSIVRYRTPVKSAYDLSLLFGLIAIGVTCGVNQKFAVLLALFISASAVLFYVFARCYPNLILSENISTGGFQVHLDIDGEILDEVTLSEYNKHLSYSQEKHSLESSRSNYGFKFDTLDDFETFKSSVVSRNENVEIRLSKT